MPAGVCATLLAGSGGTPGGGGTGATGPLGGMGATGALGGMGATGAIGTTGGVPPMTGGAPPVTGGAPPATGGVATGGAPPTCAVSTGPCSESSTSTATVNDVTWWARSTVTGDLKTYLLGANWWNQYSGQEISVNGLSFRINGNTPTVGGNAPAGFPTMFIGNYQGRSTECSDLPKQVSQITSIPTVFQTNVTSMDNSNLNATYDVWFTSTSAPLSQDATSPGNGGAFLMVWMHKPSNRQPVGSTTGSASLAGQNWTVWTGPNNGVPVVSYVSNTPISGLTFDLNDFIKNAVQNGWGVTNNQYLAVVFAGFEIWGGGNGLEMSQFCVDVR